MSDQNLEKNIYQTYIKAIENSVDCKIFNSLFVHNIKENKTYDVLGDGVYACAYYVSGLLTIFGFIDRPHATVETVTKKLLESGWVETQIDQAKPGDVLVWDILTFSDGTESDHNGFYIDKDTAISTDRIKRCVTSHHPTYGEKDGKPIRKITKVLHFEKF